jgi:hypothetical protein
MKKYNLVQEFYAVVGTPINPNLLYYVRRHKQSFAVKSAETGKVILIITNRNMVWLNRDIFPLTKAKKYNVLLDAICERFPDLHLKLQGKFLFALANTSDQRFEWSQK